MNTVVDVVADRRRHLKIKIKTLASEIRHIRHEEGKFKLPVAEKHKFKQEQVEEARAYRLEVRRRRAAARNAPWYAANLAQRMQLRDHRLLLRHVVRHEGLAYGYIRGLKYVEIEIATRKKVDESMIVKTLKKFGAPAESDAVLVEQVHQWVKAGAAPQCEVLNPLMEAAGVTLEKVTG